SRPGPLPHGEVRPDRQVLGRFSASARASAPGVQVSAYRRSLMRRRRPSSCRISLMAAVVDDPSPRRDAGSSAPPSRRIKELEVMVADVVVETPDTSTLVFFTGNDHLEYRAGHFLTIDPHQFESLERFTAFLEDLKGKKELPRAYSMCSAPQERYLAVTVKEEQYISGTTKYPPLLSPMLVKRTVRGMRLTVT